MVETVLEDDESVRIDGPGTVAVASLALDLALSVDADCIEVGETVLGLFEELVMEDFVELMAGIGLSLMVLVPLFEACTDELDGTLVDVVSEFKAATFVVVVETLDGSRNVEIEEELMVLIDAEILNGELLVLVELALAIFTEDPLAAASVTDTPVLVADVGATVFEIVGNVNCTNVSDVELDFGGRPPVDWIVGACRLSFRGLSLLAGYCSLSYFTH